MKRLKIKNRLSIFIIFGVLFTCVLGLLFVQHSQKLYEEMIYQQTVEKFQLYSQRIEEKMKELDTLSLRIMIDNEVQQALANIAEAPDSFSSFEAAKLLSKKLASYELYGETVPSILIVDEHRAVHSSGTLYEAIYDNQIGYYMKRAAAFEGASVWTGSNRQRNLFVSLREIKELKNLSLRRLGAVIIQIPAEEIVYDTTPSGFQKNQSSLIIQAQGQTIYSNLNSTGALPSFETPASGYDVVTIENDKYMYSRFTLSYSDWTFIHLLPYSSIFEGLRSMKLLLITLYAAVCLLLLALGWKFSRSITKPLDMLTAKMAQVEKGDFEVEKMSKPANHDEIWLLDRKFEHMSKRLNHLINENYVKQMKLREAEYDMLKAKLNPHFLYNTLDSINWLSRMNGQTAISNMVKALGDLLRASMNSKELNTLGEEIAIIRNYIKIQQFRFEERLNCDINIDESLINCLLPSMILQPIVENCVKYGVDAQSGICIIEINAEQNDQELVITIKDYGSGHNPSPESSYSSNGFGIYSINERLKLMYGEQYYVHMEELAGEGMTVTLSVPMQTDSGKGRKAGDNNDSDESVLG